MSKASQGSQDIRIIHIDNGGTIHLSPLENIESPIDLGYSYMAAHHISATGEQTFGIAKSFDSISLAPPLINRARTLPPSPSSSPGITSIFQNAAELEQHENHIAFIKDIYTDSYLSNVYHATQKNASSTTVVDSHTAISWMYPLKASSAEVKLDGHDLQTVLKHAVKADNASLQATGLLESLLVSYIIGDTNRNYKNSYGLVNADNKTGNYSAHLINDVWDIRRIDLSISPIDKSYKAYKSLVEGDATHHAQPHRVAKGLADTLYDLNPQISETKHVATLKRNVKRLEKRLRILDERYSLKGTHVFNETKEELSQAKKRFKSTRGILNMAREEAAKKKSLLVNAIKNVLPKNATPAIIKTLSNIVSGFKINAKSVYAETLANAKDLDDTEHSRIAQKAVKKAHNRLLGNINTIQSHIERFQNEAMPAKAGSYGDYTPGQFKYRTLVRNNASSAVHSQIRA